MLTGQSPWKNKKLTVYEQNVQGKIDFGVLDKKFMDIGKGEILDVVKGMLEKDPKERLTAEQVLKSLVFCNEFYTQSNLALNSEFNLDSIELIDPRNLKIQTSNFRPSFSSRKNSISLSKSSGGFKNECSSMSSNKHGKTSIKSKERKILALELKKKNSINYSNTHFSSPLSGGSSTSSNSDSFSENEGSPLCKKSVNFRVGSLSNFVNKPREPNLNTTHLKKKRGITYRNIFDSHARRFAFDFESTDNNTGRNSLGSMGRLDNCSMDGTSPGRVVQGLSTFSRAKDML